MKIKKQWHLLIITLLLVGQMFLGPLGSITAYANEPDPEPEVTQPAEGEKGGNDGQESDDNSETSGEEPGEPGQDDPNEGAGSGGGEEGSDDGSAGEGGNQEGEDSTNEGTPQSPLGNLSPEDETMGEESEGEPEEGEEIAPLDDDVTLDFSHLIVNGQEIKEANDAANVTPKLGDDITIYYNLAIEASKDYGIGSTFTLQLPESLLAFNSSQLSGSLEDDKGFKINYATDTATKIVTFTIQNELTEGERFSGSVSFQANFGAEDTKDGLEQTLEIPIKGEDSIKIPFTFKPSSNKSSMSKSGTAGFDSDGNRIIDWTVWTNRSGADLQGAKLEDNLGKGHELDGNITVNQYKVGLTGVGDQIESTTTHSEFPVTLADGRYAYKITYRTKVTREAKEETEWFTNKAILKQGDSELDSQGSQVSHQYGTKLDKEVSSINNYSAKWQIKYNFFGAQLGEKEVTDTIKGAHKIKDGSIEVYNVNLNANGKGTKGSKVDVTPQVDGDGKSFTIELDSSNGQAYIIEYVTEYDGEYITQNGDTVSNEVKYKVGEQTIQDSAQYWYSAETLKKSRASYNTATQEIEWKINVKIERNMDDFIIEDTFSSSDTSATRQELVGNAADAFTITGASFAQGKPEVTLKDDGTGFTLNFGNLTAGTEFTITYKTKYELKSNGEAYTEYKNTAEARWKHPDPETNTSYKETRDATFKPKDHASSTHGNGYKEGSFDHVEQKFNWELAVNFNKQDANGTTVTDTIGEGHKLITDSIKVYQLNLGPNDDRGKKGEELPSGNYTLSSTEKGFTLTFKDLGDAQKNQAYLITYQTEDEDEIIGHENGGTYENKATYTTIEGTKFDYEKSVTVKHENELIKKSATQVPAQETIDWTIELNKSHSNLGTIKFTDTVSDNQLILKDTFKIREMTIDKEGNITYGEESAVPNLEIDGQTITITGLDMAKKGYQLTYTTFFLGGDQDEFSNEASISYKGTHEGEKTESSVDNEKYNFNDSSGTITATKGELALQKYEYDPLTGKRTPLEGITFELYNKFGAIKLYEGTTEENGQVTFSGIRYGKYILKEVDQDDKYVPLGDVAVIMNDSTNFDKNGGLHYVVDNVLKVDETNVCERFEITVNDVDGEPRKNLTLVLKEKNTNEEITVVTDEHGKITKDRNDLPAGVYEVIETVQDEDGKDTKEIIDEITVTYNEDCKEVLIQPAPSCDDFTVTVFEDSEKAVPRANAELTLKQNGQKVADVTTDGDGSFTVPSTTPAGTYQLYEDKQYLEKITISYKDECKTELIQAPSCPSFTLTVKDEDGQPLKETEIVIKDSEGKEVKTGKTNENGQVSFDNFEPGEYKVFDKTGEEIGSFATDTTCEAEVQLAPSKACPQFTIVVNDENGVLTSPLTKITLINKDTNEKYIVTEGMKADGKITFENDTESNYIPAGAYEVYDESLLLGEISVSYTDAKCEAELALTTAPSCPSFTLTVKDRSGKPRADVNVILKDSNGVVVKENGKSIFETNEDGQIEIDNKQIQAGKYTVYEVTVDEDGNIKSEKRIGTITVDNRCEASVQPPRGGGGGGTPDPEDPEDPTDPDDPNNPDGEDLEDPTDPNDPNNPDGEDPEDPTDPDDPNNPDGEDPDDPTNPDDPNNPDGNDPNDPNNPDGNDPNDPDNSGGVEGDGDKGGNNGNNGGNEGDSGVKGDGDKQGNGDKNDPNRLPDTATSMFTYGLIGFILLLAGIVLRRRANA